MTLMLCPTVATIGENIRRIRTAKGIRTQGDLAKALGVPQPQASDWENDRYNWQNAKLKTLLKIAKALGVSVEDLVDDVDSGHKGVDLTSPVSPASTDGTDRKEGADVQAAAQRREITRTRYIRLQATLTEALEEIRTGLREIDAESGSGKRQVRRRAGGGGRT